MAFLKAIGYSLVAGIITVLAFFWGTIISVITVVGSIVLLIAGIFTGVFYLLWESKQEKNQNKD